MVDSRTLEGADWRLRKPLSLVKLLALAHTHKQGDYEGKLSNVQSAIGDETFCRAWTEGPAMSLEEAVEYGPSGDGNGSGAERRIPTLDNSKWES